MKRKTRFLFGAIYTRWGNRYLDLRVPPGQEIENVNTWRGRRTNPARPSGRVDTQRRAGFSSADFTYLYSTFVCLPKHHISAPFTCVKVEPFACRRASWFLLTSLVRVDRSISSFLAEGSLQDRSWMNWLFLLYRLSNIWFRLKKKKNVDFPAKKISIILFHPLSSIKLKEWFLKLN